MWLPLSARRDGVVRSDSFLRQFSLLQRQTLNASKADFTVGRDLRMSALHIVLRAVVGMALKDLFEESTAENGRAGIELGTFVSEHAKLRRW